MKLIGQTLLWAGFLSGALATVIHSPQEGVEYVKENVTPEYAAEHGFEFTDLSNVVVPDEGWHLIPWTWYLISAAVCIAGIVVLYKSRSSVGQKSEKSKSSLAEIKLSFDRLIEKTNALAKETETLAPSQIVHRIDHQLADDFRTIADGRDSITAEYGLEVFADVMTQFAAGERSINRAWSASADGYINEAATCIDRGIKMLLEARNILDAAGTKSR